LTTGKEPILSDIRAVQNWGKDLEPKVPSAYTYSASRGDCWGSGIGDNAYVITLTKLDFPIPSRVEALDALKRMLVEAQQLKGLDAHTENIPWHLIHTSEDVATDYMKEVASCVRRDIATERDPQALRKFPIDFIITHPAVWDPRARNLTFRAVNTAFRELFPEVEMNGGSIRLATEPEACAQFTMRAALDGGFRNSHLRRVKNQIHATI
jgi:hypothetical protein